MTHCSECGEARVRTPSGYVCPNGHGRIVPREKAEKRAKAEALARLPVAFLLDFCVAGCDWPSRSRFTVDGSLGIWRRTFKGTPGAVTAMFSGRRVYLEHDERLEEQVCRVIGVERPKFSTPRKQ